MSKLQELFGGALSVTRHGNMPDTQPDYRLTDSDYHFADIHDVQAHDDGKAKERAEFIAKAVNNYEALLDDIEAANCMGSVSKILREYGR